MISLRRLRRLRRIQDRQAPEVYRQLVSRPGAAQLLACVHGPRAGCEAPPLLIIPGAFHREYPQHGADGARLLAAARELGMQASRVPLESFSSTTENAALIAERLRHLSGPAPVVVSLSKGSLDFLRYLDRTNGAPRIRAWFSVSGLFFGTHLVEALLRSRVRRAMLRCYFARRGYPFAALDELRPEHAATRSFSGGFDLRFPVVHVLGVPRFGDFSSKLARRSALNLLEHGASDAGGFLLADALRLPGHVIPILGEDHYFSRTDPAALLTGFVSMLAHLEATDEASPPGAVRRPGGDAAVQLEKARLEKGQLEKGQLAKGRLAKRSNPIRFL